MTKKLAVLLAAIFLLTSVFSLGSLSVFAEDSQEQEAVTLRTLTITPRDVTIVVGEPLPRDFDFDYEGWASGDGPSKLTVRPRATAGITSSDKVMAGTIRITNLPEAEGYVVALGTGVIRVVAKKGDEKIHEENKFDKSTTVEKKATGTTIPKVTVGKPIGNKTAITTAMAEAMVASGKAEGGLITVRIKNSSSISSDALKAMVAKAAGNKVQFNADTMVGKRVDVRLGINPATATKDILLGGATTGSGVTGVKTSFSKNFSNKLAVISLDQQGDFGMSVQVSAYLELKDLDTDNLYFYSYDKGSNKYYAVESPQYRIDDQGYLRFNTSRAGYIVVSEGALTK